MPQILTIQIPDDVEIDEIRSNVVEGIGFYLHELEAQRKVADFHNMGWGVAGSELAISIASKTSHGILTTNYDSETGHLEHRWEDE